jgi:hypothetical protein
MNMQQYPSGEEVMEQEQAATPEGATPESGLEQVKAAVQTIQGFISMLAQKGIPGGQEAMQHLQAMIAALGKGGQGQAPAAAPAPGAQAPAPAAGPRPMGQPAAGRPMGQNRPMNTPVQ